MSFTSIKILSVLRKENQLVLSLNATLDVKLMVIWGVCRRRDFCTPTYRHLDICTDQGLVQDGAVGGDGVLSLLHHGHFPAVVRAVCQAVDRAALGAGAD